MSDAPILAVENVSKKFCRSLKRSMIYGALDLAKDVIGRQTPRDYLRPAEFWALRDISFTLTAGETLGVVGSNGSGKSTLLRLIAGIYPPDMGRILVRGKVGALIALGAGFHPHMTGRENVFLNGAILGMSRAELSDRFEEIVEFSEIGEFIDAPVSTYSSGMTVRLGFSIAAHSSPQLLIVDEVLAVGDLNFALKCHRKMVEYRQSGGTTILVSHNNLLIRNVCKRAMWLDKGIVRTSGDVHQVCDAYEAGMVVGLTPASSGKRLDYDPHALLDKVEFLDKNGIQKGDFAVGEPMIVRIYVNSLRKVERPIFVVTFESVESHVVTSCASDWDGLSIDSISGEVAIDFHIPRMPFKRGKYFCSVSFAEGEVNNALSWHDKTYSFLVTTGPLNFGMFNPFATWSVKQLRSSAAQKEASTT